MRKSLKIFICIIIVIAIVSSFCLYIIPKINLKNDIKNDISITMSSNIIPTDINDNTLVYHSDYIDYKNNDDYVFYTCIFEIENNSDYLICDAWFDYCKGDNYIIDYKPDVPKPFFVYTGTACAIPIIISVKKDIQDDNISSIVDNLPKKINLRLSNIDEDDNVINFDDIIESKSITVKKDYVITQEDFSEDSIQEHSVFY